MSSTFQKLHQNQTRSQQPFLFENHTWWSVELHQPFPLCWLQLESKILQVIVIPADRSRPSGSTCLRVTKYLFWAWSLQNKPKLRCSELSSTAGSQNAAASRSSTSWICDSVLSPSQQWLGEGPLWLVANPVGTVSLWCACHPSSARNSTQVCHFFLF